jgi:hypothetical protein
MYRTEKNQIGILVGVDRVSSAISRKSMDQAADKVFSKLEAPQK